MSKAKFNVTLIRPKNYVHSDALLDSQTLVCETLKSLGYECESSENKIRPDARNVVIGWHLLQPANIQSLLGADTIFWQLEQLSDREGWWNEDRARVLRAAGAIWDYAPQNIEFLKSKGFVADLVPFGFHPALERFAPMAEEEKDIDVFFTGCVSDRRLKVLDAMQSRGLKLAIASGLYEHSERDSWAARARICLNFHYYGKVQVFEQMRVSYWLNNRCLVLSEMEQGQEYCGILTGSYEELADKCERICATSAHWRKNRARICYELFRMRPMESYIACALMEVPCAA